jgi:hypothetical protein
LIVSVAHAVGMQIIGNAIARAIINAYDMVNFPFCKVGSPKTSYTGQHPYRHMNDISDKKYYDCRNIHD